MPDSRSPWKKHFGGEGKARMADARRSRANRLSFMGQAFHTEGRSVKGVLDALGN